MWRRLFLWEATGIAILHFTRFRILLRPTIWSQLQVLASLVVFPPGAILPKSFPVGLSFFRTSHGNLAQSFPRKTRQIAPSCSAVIQSEANVLSSRHRFCEKQMRKLLIKAFGQWLRPSRESLALCTRSCLSCNQEGL